MQETVLSHLNVSDVTAAERGEMRRQQHGEIYYIFSGRSAFH